MTAYGGFRQHRMFRTVTSDRVLPLRRGDVVPERVPEMAAPAKRRGMR